MFTISPIAFPIFLTVFPWLDHGMGQMCAHGGSCQTTTPEQDSDIVSLLQAGNLPHRIVATGKRQLSFENVKQNSSFENEKDNVTLAVSLPKATPVISAFTQLSSHCEKLSQALAAGGSEWVLPVIVVVTVLLAVASYTFEVSHDEPQSGRKYPSGMKSPMAAATAPVIKVLPRQQAGTTQRQQQSVAISASAPLLSSHRNKPLPSLPRQHRSTSIGAAAPATASLILSRPDDAVQPLCPTLVLPAVGSRFAINVDLMERAESGSELSVCGFDLKPMLKLRINDSEFGTRLDIYVEGDQIAAGARPRCSVIAPQDDFSPFVIRGPGDKFYGTFQNCQGKSDRSEVVVDGRPIMVIEGATSSMQMSVFTPDPQNQPVAMASRNDSGQKNGESYFEIRVLPGSDAMLVIAVVMAIMLFIDHDH